jgi:hypothetical protein
VTWFKVDDGFPTHSKAQAAGLQGRALWLAAGALCAREDLDGVVPRHMLKMWAAIADVPAPKATRLLVAAGLWHPHDGLCADCLDNRDAHRVELEAEERELTPLCPGDHYFHDWCDYQLAKDGKEDPIKRKRDLRARQLHRSEGGKRVVAAVRRRDRDLCRYCGVLTAWHVGPGGDQRSAQAGLRGTIDHLDPFDWSNTVAGCVVACRTCNGQKRNRTPEQWVEGGGRPLRPERWFELDTLATTGGPSADHPPANGSAQVDPLLDHERDLVHASRGAQDGPGSWSGRGPAAAPDVVAPMVPTETDPSTETTETGDPHA